MKFIIDRNSMKSECVWKILDLSNGIRFGWMIILIIGKGDVIVIVINYGDDPKSQVNLIFG